jgi:hypothetical protein
MKAIRFNQYGEPAQVLAVQEHPCAGYLGHPFGKQVNFWEKISIVSKRVNGQFSISACLKLLASQMRRGDYVSFSRASFLNGCPK